jgi:hypothetical protein
MLCCAKNVFHNELAALVIMQAQDYLVELLLDHGLELLEHVEHVGLLPEEVDPQVAQVVVDKEQPIAESGRGQNRQLVQGRVNTLEERHRAVVGTLREQVTVMLAADARLAVRRRRCIVLDSKPGSNLALDGLL